MEGYYGMTAKAQLQSAISFPCESSVDDGYNSLYGTTTWSRSNLTNLLSTKCVYQIAFPAALGSPCPGG